jgi:hypothetical protein
MRPSVADVPPAIACSAWYLGNPGLDTLYRSGHSTSVGSDFDNIWRIDYGKTDLSVHSFRQRREAIVVGIPKRHLFLGPCVIRGGAMSR